MVFRQPESKAVEVTLVRADGLVERWEGDAAETVRLLIEDGVSECKRELPEPVVTTPQRKVTEVTGHVEDYPGDETYIASRVAPGNTMLSSVLPDETRKGPCMTYRFRITVEAVRVNT